eukprot:1161916-Pelagomonas_calceolata.AAC.7
MASVMAPAHCEAERPQASSLQAPSRPIGRLLDLFCHAGIIGMALGWKSRLLGGGWVPPSGSLPPKTLPPKNGPQNTRIYATYAFLWVSNAYGSPQTRV